jgi:hypothetical protein
MKLPFVRIGVALDNGSFLCAQGTFRHPYMLSNSSAEFPRQFPQVRLSLWSEWPIAEDTNRRSNLFNLSVG